MEVKVKHDHRSWGSLYPRAISDARGGDMQDGSGGYGKGDGRISPDGAGKGTATDAHQHPVHPAGTDHGNTDHRGGATLGSTDATGNVTRWDVQPAAYNDVRFFNNQAFFEAGFHNIRVWHSLFAKHDVDVRAQDAFYLLAQRDETGWEICNDLLGKLQQKK